MSTKSKLQGALFVLMMTLSVASFAAPDATIQQVYDAAHAGRIDEAQAMMQQVLRDHPDSWKAHFVEAELLAKQKRYDSADAELSKAESLSPGLPKEKPEAVDDLRRLIVQGKAHASSNYSVAGNAVGPANSGSSPWPMIIVGLGLIGFIVMVVRFMANRNQVQPAVMQNGAPGFGGNMPAQPYPAPSYGSGPMMGGTGGGIGSGIVGGLATGAAVGAGIVAGEALMHHFTDGNNSSGNVAAPVQRNDYDPTANDNLGGNDFGVNDTSSWDDGSSNSGGSDFGSSGSDDW